MGDDEITNRVNLWLDQTGYPLEMRVASAFRSADLRDPWEVSANLWYDDVTTSAFREADLYASWVDFDHAVSVSFTLIIECKSTQQPWVIFRDDQAQPPSDGITVLDPYWAIGLRLLNQQYPAQLQDFCKALSKHMSGFLTLKEFTWPGYAIAEAFKRPNERDVAHNAVLQAISAAQGLGSPMRHFDTRREPELWHLESLRLRWQSRHRQPNRVYASPS